MKCSYDHCLHILFAFCLCSGWCSFTGMSSLVCQFLFNLMSLIRILTVLHNWIMSVGFAPSSQLTISCNRVAMKKLCIFITLVSSLMKLISRTNRKYNRWAVNSCCHPGLRTKDTFDRKQNPYPIHILDTIVTWNSKTI